MKTIYSVKFAASVSAVAGFLFGFDTAVISGADLPIQQLWNTSALFHGTFIMSMALWGTVIGALLGSYPTDIYGRKKTLIAIGVLYFISAIGSALALDPYSFSFFRFIGGLGVGASSVAVPAYISEIAPSDQRGRLVILYQFMIVFGILIAFLSNWIIGTYFDGLSWRWMLGIEAFPALCYVILVPFIAESPRWLINHQHNVGEAKKILSHLFSSQQVEQQIEQIQSEEKKQEHEALFSGLYRKPLTFAFFIAFFNQMSGINFVIYYAPRIFEAAGLPTSSALLSSVGIGIINLVFTLLGIFLIDKAGRKPLLIMGSIGYIVSLGMVSWAFYAAFSGYLVVSFLFLFIAAHAIGQGAVIWVFISEIFPNHLRAKGQSFGSGVHWVFAALITLFTLFFMEILGDQPFQLFVFFMLMMVLQLVFVLKWIPETKGRTLEELSAELSS